VEAVCADNVQIQSLRSPVGIITDALKSESKSDSGAYVYLWDQVRAAATSDSDDRPLPAILSDDTINLFSLVSIDPTELALLGISGPASTLATPLSPVTETFLSATANGNGVPVPARRPTLPSSTPQSPKDWAEFSSAGFGETTISKNFASTLLDKDVEVTDPPVRRKSSKRKQQRSTTSARTSVEFSSPASRPTTAPEQPEGPKLILAATKVVQLDEAFIDFWRDAVVDPVSSDWPKFVVGELKHPLTPHSISASSEDGENATSGSPINWIIIEEKFRRTTPPPTPVIPLEALTSTSGGLKVSATPLKRTSSPRPSFGDKKNSLSATFKRFTLFGGSRDDLTEDVDSSGGKKKAGASKSPKIGELGEVLSEEAEPHLEVPKKLEKVEESGEGKDRAVTATAGVVGGAAAGVVLANAVGSDEGKKEAVEDVPTEEAKEEVTKTKVNELPALPQDDSPVKDAVVSILLASTPDTPAPAVGEPEEVQKSLPEVPPVVEEPAQEPAPEPVVDGLTKSEPSPTPFPHPELEETATPELVADEILPPAPESLVSHGETPGPQLALDSTEAGLHHVPEHGTDVKVPQESATEPADDVEETAAFSTPSPEPTIEHLEDKVEDPAADAGVDLDPVPIIPNGPAEPAEGEPEVVPESTVVDSTPEPDPAPIQPIVEDEDDVPAHPVENPQPVVTEDASPLPPNVSVSGETEKVARADVVTEDVPVVKSAPDG
jgi:hypothetical protein